MMMRAFLIFVFSLFVFNTHVEAKGTVSVGQVIPHNLKLEDADGKIQDFSSLTGKKGMVLVFVRSADWCPFCQKQLLELNKSVSDFQKQGYEIVSVSYDQVAALQKFKTMHKPKITMLSDPRSEAIRTFGLLNQDTAKGTRSYGVPYPAVYIINKNKKVQAIFFEEGYKKRPSVPDILKKIEQLNPKPKYVPPPMTIEEMGQDPISAEEMFIETPEKINDQILLPDNFSPEDIDFDGVDVEPEMVQPRKIESKIISPDTMPNAASNAGTTILMTAP